MYEVKCSVVLDLLIYLTLKLLQTEHLTF